MALSATNIGKEMAKKLYLQRTLDGTCYHKMFRRNHETWQPHNCDFSIW